jgi:hypothetical protein
MQIGYNLNPSPLRSQKQPSYKVNMWCGQVTKGLWRGIHEVAIKCVASEGTLGQNFMQEVALLKSCRNAHIVQVKAPLPKFQRV